MTRRVAIALTGLLALSAAGSAFAQEAKPSHYRYFFSAAYNTEGMKHMQKISPSGQKTGVDKFIASVGGKLESWYWGYGSATAYGFVDFPDDIAAATAQATVNTAGLVQITWHPVLTADDADKAFAKSVSTQPPQVR